MGQTDTTELMKIVAGSHLYGTSTPASDRDYKSVFVPSARDILLGRINSISQEGSTGTATTRNTSADVDQEAFALTTYLRLLSEGKTLAVEMLFAPEAMYLGAPHPLWRRLQAGAHRLVSRRTQSFYGYCRAQAAKYCAKTERMEAVAAALALLQDAAARHGDTARLGEAAGLVEAFATGGLLCTRDILLPNGTWLRHLSVADRQVPYTASIKTARETYERQAKTYGQRANSPLTQAKDWKALSHAVRIGREAIELFDTGRIRLPRPDAPDLLAIKTGQAPYPQVLDEIDGLLERILNAADRSALPDAPDTAFIEELLIEAHGTMVRATPRSGCAG